MVICFYDSFLNDFHTWIRLYNVLEAADSYLSAILYAALIFGLTSDVLFGKPILIGVLLEILLYLALHCFIKIKSKNDGTNLLIKCRFISFRV